MSTVLTFHFGELPVRLAELDGQRYFVIRDICNILGFSNPNRELAKHTGNKPLYERIRTPGGLQVVRLVPKEDVDRLLAANRGQKAALLARWLKTEVYPNIFPTGNSDAAKAILCVHLALMHAIMSVPFDQQPTVIFGVPDLSGKEEKHANR